MKNAILVVLLFMSSVSFAQRSFTLEAVGDQFRITQRDSFPNRVIVTEFELMDTARTVAAIGNRAISFRNQVTEREEQIDRAEDVITTLDGWYQSFEGVPIDTLVNRTFANSLDGSYLVTGGQFTNLTMTITGYTVRVNAAVGSLVYNSSRKATITIAGRTLRLYDQGQGVFKGKDQNDVVYEIRRQ